MSKEMCCIRHCLSRRIEEPANIKTIMDWFKHLPYCQLHYNEIYNSTRFSNMLKNKYKDRYTL